MKTTLQQNVNKTAYSYIRFSTPEQELGDSERRQLALAKAYCVQHGLTLADAVADKGVSGYHGRNHTNGELGKLLKQMKPGETLLIEDSDRWSRQDPIDALTRLREEVRRGIEVVFLRTGTRVTAENFSDIGVLVPNFFGALLGNGESAKKAERIAATWEEKRQAVQSGKPARVNRLPCWLRWNEDTDKPEVLEHKAAIIRQMFDLAAQGQGVLEIVRAMVASNTPPLTTPKKKAPRVKAVWNPTTVRNILVNRAVTGACTSFGDAVEGVWPRIVDDTLFAVVQQKLGIQAHDKRPGHKSEANLLTGLVRCACGQHNLILHWGGGHGKAHNDARLVCQGAGAGRSKCGFSGVPYKLVEDSLLSFLGDSDLIRPLLASPEQKPSRLDELQARHTEAQKQAAKLAKLILGDDEPPRMLYERLKQEEQAAKQLASEIDAEELRERGEQPALLAYGDFVASLPSLAKDPAKRPELRRAVRGVIDSITLDPRGENRSKGQRGARGRYLPGSGQWSYIVQLRGASETVAVDINREGWSYRSLRPEQYAKVGNLLA